MFWCNAAFTMPLEILVSTLHSCSPPYPIATLASKPSDSQPAVLNCTRGWARTQRSDGSTLIITLRYSVFMWTPRSSFTRPFS